VGSPVIPEERDIQSLMLLEGQGGGKPPTLKVRDGEHSLSSGRLENRFREMLTVVDQSKERKRRTILMGVSCELVANTNVGEDEEGY